MAIVSFSFEKYRYICACEPLYLLTFIINGNNIDVDPQLIFLRELVILNGCEGSQAAFKIDASTSLSMTFKRWVNIYIIALVFLCHPTERSEVSLLLATLVFKRE